MIDQPVPYGYVYRITNKVNGKVYIGLRKLTRDKTWRQYLGSGKLIKAAISKYGADSFTKSFISYAFSEDELQQQEWNEIQRLKAQGSAEYNLFTGKGAGGDTFSRLKTQTLDEVRAKQSKGIRESEKHKNSLAKRKQVTKQRHLSEYELHRNEIIRRYEQERENIADLSNFYHIPYTFIREFLIADGVTIRKSQSMHGHAVSQSQRDKVSKSLKGKALNRSKTIKICQNEKCSKEVGIDGNRSIFCSKECKRSARVHAGTAFEVPYEDLYRMWIVERKTVHEISEILSCKYRTIYNLLASHGIPRGKEAQLLRESLHRDIA